MKRHDIRTAWLGAVLLVAGFGVVPAVVAETDTATVTVTATVPSRVNLAITRAANSSTRGSADQILFDLLDSEDAGVTNPNAGFMYAPYRSEIGKNWHLANIQANGSSMTLTADVTGTAGPRPLAEVLDTFFGGLFASDGSDKGGKSSDWELLDTFARTLNEPFSGEAPFNYRLRLAGVPAGTYGGTVTYTLTSN